MFDEGYLPSEDTVMKYIVRELSDYRVEHCLGVARVAGELCYLAEVPEALGRMAGLLHDHMREVPDGELLAIARNLGITVGPMEEAHPVLLHAVVGAELLEDKFGIRNPDVTQAVRTHTTGGPDMGLLARIIYIADAVEPTRNYPEARGLRDLAYDDLNAGFRECVKAHLRHLVKRERAFHPDTVACWNQLLSE